jgi:uncharacterized hydrophobic protein (TIGR00341 family)
MSLRIIEISAPENSSDKIKELAEEYNAVDCWQSERKEWQSKDDDKRMTTRILVDVTNQQDMMDALTRAVNDHDGWRIILLPVEATMPRPENPEENEQGKQANQGKKWIKVRNILRGSVTREELLQDMEKGGRLTFDFVLLAFLSTIVAGIGLIQSDVAIIIGAMVIAPLLGPNLALAFGAALGDKDLILNAIKTNVVGLGFTLLISALAGYFITEASVTESEELLNRTNVSYASIALALAAGGAAVLSLTTGVSSALVGVMVAVALMPPAVALGLTVGNAQWEMAFGSGLLLATNVVCINLAALGVFRLKGIKPRTWYEEKQARKASRVNAVIWFSMLIILAGMIWVKKQYLGD